MFEGVILPTSPIELKEVHVSTLGQSQVYGSGGRKVTHYDYIEFVHNGIARKIDRISVMDVIDAGLAPGVQGSFYMCPVPKNTNVMFLFATEIAGIKRVSRKFDVYGLKAPGLVSILFSVIFNPLSLETRGHGAASRFVVLGMFWLVVNLMAFAIPAGLLLIYKIVKRNKESAFLKRGNAAVLKFIDELRLKGFQIE